MEYRSKPTALEINPQEFKKIGYELVDTIASFLEGIGEYPVTTGHDPHKYQAKLGQKDLPEEGRNAQELMRDTSDLLIHNSLFNGHPKFLGFITSSPTHIGVMADFLAAAINPNLGGQILSPIGTEIERQTIRWLAQFVGYPEDCGGLLVSGGNMANFVGFLAARKDKAKGNIRKEGTGVHGQLTCYVSGETHTWIQKAADLFGVGTNAIRWIPVNDNQQMDLVLLREAIEKDLAEGSHPFFVTGNAGSVSTGVIDDLESISRICKEYDLWFHIDGAYGVPAAVLEEYKDAFKGLHLADSVALDPHKWLYSPLEAGCTLVRHPEKLTNAFSYHPPYYYKKEESQELDYYAYGMQNSRGFRALKVWLGFKQIGRKGFKKLIREDIHLTQLLAELLEAHPRFQVFTSDLSICSFRYLPEGKESDQGYLNAFNQSLLEKIQGGGDLFITNAIIGEDFAMRSCIVNFRTREEDIRQLPGIIEKYAIEHLESFIYAPSKKE